VFLKNLKSEDAKLLWDLGKKLGVTSMEDENTILRTLEKMEMRDLDELNKVSSGRVRENF
jgi:hypothetical protein